MSRQSVGPRSRSFRSCIKAAVLCTLMGLAGGSALAASEFALPTASEWTLWSAVNAGRAGVWEVGGPNGAGERYVQPASGGAVLLFPFEAAGTTTIRVRPVWWPTGEQKLAKRFPYPLERQPGPAALDSVGTTVFATAPAAGRVIAIDAVSERPLGAIDVGGYLADLVADRDQGRVYVADALGDRVVTIDANTRVVLGAMEVSGTPWSLALSEGVLYVACRDSKRLWGFDTGTGKMVCDIALPAQPISLEAVGNPATRLVVRFQQQAFDVFTLEPAVEDQPQFVSAESAGKVYAADGGRNRVLVMDAKTQNVESEISVPGQPSSVAVVGDVTLQRTAATEQDGPWLPRTVSRLYVICRESNDLAVVDLKTNQIVKRVPLAGEARGVKFVAMPDPCWWPLMADDRIPFALQPRVAVEYRPMMLDLATQRLLPAPVETPEAAPARTATSVKLAAAAKRFTAGDDLLVGVDDKRWVDISALADPQRLPDPPLTAKDVAGSITISVDGGPERDWASGRWITPDNELFLVNETEEFWRYNAPTLEVGPGQHVLQVKANSAFARLEAIAVRRSPEPQLDITLLPEPQEVHGRVPLASYQGVFYDQEPARFTLRTSYVGAAPLSARLSWTLRNYLGETVERESKTLQLGAGDMAIAPKAQDSGRYTLTAVVDTPEGQVTTEARYLKLPKLEHPRMFWRPEDTAAVQARIAKYPNLFRRYGDWLERMSQKEGHYPERFLPAGLTADELMAVGPEGVPEEGNQKLQACAWRMFELGWRMLAAQFATVFLKPDSEKLRSKVETLRNAEKTDWYCQYHHHGPFFPGAETSLVDLASDEQRPELKLYRQMAAASGDGDTMPWTLVTLEEPLTPEKRALIYKIMTLENNAQQYFETHQGSRGGLWWSSPYTGCQCPMMGYLLTFLYLHNIFGEPRLFEDPLFSGYLTFQWYADPLQDSRGLQPGRRGPNGEPMRWILSALAKHPLEKANYQWDEWIAKMEGPIPGNEQAEVDKLMALDKMALTGPLHGGANYFVSGVTVPLALALGWYDPKAPVVTRQEMPPTAIFDVEGWTVMRSGVDAKATEVTFVSGVRDHTYRTKPNHFTILKAGQYLVGTPALLEDDGNMVAVWGNSVVINDEWPQQWSLNLTSPRDGEHLMINRFSPAGFTYISRNRKAFGYSPPEEGFGGGLDLHGHTETLFMREGRLLAYQTWPLLDYVAGDASNAWPADQVSQINRQLVFVKPDYVVIYDRVKMGPAGRESKWMAATGPVLTANGDSFVVKSGSEYLTGRALLPLRPVLTTPEPPADLGWVWQDQKLLMIAPPQQESQTEYLVVMRVGHGAEPLPEMELIHDAASAGVKLKLSSGAVEVRFNRAGPAGGLVLVPGNGGNNRYDLREAIVDSYANWQSDPRYQRWVKEARFQFVIPAADGQ